MITLDLSILNQKGTPMFNSDIFANRPAAGVVGRIFISTDTKVFYRDTGTTWELVGGSGSGTITGSGTAGTLPIWISSTALGDSSLLEGSTKISTIKDIQADGYYLSGMTLGTGALYFSTTPEDRVTLANYNVGGTVYIEVDGGSYAAKWGSDLSLTNYGYIAATPTLTAANNASSLASYGINTLSYAAGFSSNNIGALYGGIAGFNLQTFAGSATFAQANVASGGASVNSIDFSSAGSTITMTQSSGIRVMSGQQNLFQYQGTNSGTITHAAISQNTGFYRPSGASGTLTITNAYSHLINALDDYGAGFTFTNRWGIYQAGASDKNYFAANMLLGSVVDNGNRLQVTGNGYFTGSITANLRSFINGAAGYLLDIRENSANQSGLQIYSDSTEVALVSAYNTTANPFTLYVGGSRRLTIGTNGYLGVGTFNPSGGLEVSVFGTYSYFSGNANGTYPANIQGISFGWNTSAGGGESIIAYNKGGGSNGGLVFANNDGGSYNVRMNLTSGGFLGIGTSVPLSLLHAFQNTAGVQNQLTLENINTTAGNDGSAIYFKGYQGSLAKISGYGIPTAQTGGYLQLQTYTDNTTTNIGILIHQNGNISMNSVSNPGQNLYLNGSLRIDGQSSGTAGGSSGQHLIINLDGTTYKIALLNP